MIEGIIVVVVLVLALIGLHLWNKPKAVVIAPVEVKAPPMPPVKTPRQEAERYERFRERADTVCNDLEREVIAARLRAKINLEHEQAIAREQARKAQQERYAEHQRRPAASTHFGAPYGQSQAYVDTDSALLGVVAAVAAVAVAETIYETVVDSSPAYQYSDPTPSDYGSSSSDSSSSWSGE